MAKLYFRYGAVGSAKTLNLLAVAHNYERQGKTVKVLKPAFDVRFGTETVASRAGLEREADLLLSTETLLRPEDFDGCHCVLVDEAQFLTRDQVFQLGEVSDHLNVPVLAYGLRTDFQGEPFEGSKYLLAWSDNLKEIKAICDCGSKATMVVRLDESGAAITEGSQIEIGGNDRYVSMCRKHFRERFYA